MPSPPPRCHYCGSKLTFKNGTDWPSKCDNNKCHNSDEYHSFDDIRNQRMHRSIPSIGNRKRRNER